MEISSIFQTILQNQVVTGLSFTALLGGAAYQLRTIPHLVKTGALRFFTVELTVMSTDAAFDWMERWLGKHPYTQKTKMMRLRAIEADRNYDLPSSDPAARETEWSLSPGPGMHVFWWQGKPIILERSMIAKEAVNSRARTAKPLEQLHFRTIGRSQAGIRALIEEARLLSADGDIVPVREWDEYAWSVVRGRSQRALDTVILKDGQAERIIADLDWFLASREWYLHRGIPYRRGYLFVGPPGTGKTSIVLALAGYLNRPICVLNLGSVETDNALFDAVRAAPPNAIVLIEDIDCAFPSQTREADEKDTGDQSRVVSKAALLNALDGITTPDGRIFIMTSNYPERLDPALVRPGRADMHERFDHFGPAEQIRMSRRFYQDFTPLPFAISPAEMQAAFMQFPNDAEDARDFLFQKFSTDHPRAARSLISSEPISRDAGGLPA